MQSRLTNPQLAVLAVADHLSRQLRPLYANTVPHFNTIKALLRRGYLERYADDEFMFRITEAGRKAMLEQAPKRGS